MRWMLACWVAVTACSLSSGSEEAGSFDDGDQGGTNGPVECEVDDDCMTDSATCCDCPTFASRNTASDACSGVVCPSPMSCPANVEAVCIDQRCELACVAMVCELSCQHGFARSATGCLSCECATVADGGCSEDTQCTRTRADCCGCEHGGSDTAVLASTVATYDSGLSCPASPQCPTDTNVCNPALTPQCVQGSCELALPVPPAACGRPDLPACPEGTVCTINANEPGSAHGVGVCVAAS
ncbi:MAG: hypothetical protein AB7P03_27930 [Kofleriaceae bacterium]